MKSSLVFVALFLFVALFAGCKTSGISESTDPLDAVSGAFNKLKTLPSYYMKNETKGDGTTLERYRESQDRYWQHFKTNGIETEVFVLGEYAYGKTNEKPWVKQKVDKNAEASSGQPRGADEPDLKLSSEIKFDSKSNLNGMKALIYTYKMPIIPEDPSLGKTTEKMWINADTGLPLKIESAVGSREPTRITTFDYEKKIDLKAPVIE